MTGWIVRIVTIAAFICGGFGAFVPAAHAGGVGNYCWLVQENNSGVAGQVTFTDNGDGTTTVFVQVEGYGSAERLLAAIHDGKREDYKAEPSFELNDVVGGMSTTLLPISLLELQSEQRTVVIRDAGGFVLASGNTWAG